VLAAAEAEEAETRVRPETKSIEAKPKVRAPTSVARIDRSFPFRFVIMRIAPHPFKLTNSPLELPQRQFHSDKISANKIAVNLIGRIFLPVIPVNCH
jgi:hypothetical protein